MEKSPGNNKKDAIVKVSALGMRAEVLQPDIDTKLKNTFIVVFWATIFDWLQLISPFYWIHKLYQSITVKEFKASYVEAWVLSNLALSLVILVFLWVWTWVGSFLAPQLHSWQIGILIYAGVRILEIAVYQANVLLFDSYRAKRMKKPYVVQGFRRLIVLLLQNYIEVILWFAVGYCNLYFLFHSEHISLGEIGGALYFSLVTMSTLGFGDIVPKENLGSFLVVIQTLIGIFIVLGILARFIPLLPKPETVDEF